MCNACLSRLEHARRALKVSSASFACNLCRRRRSNNTKHTMTDCEGERMHNAVTADSTSHASLAIAVRPASYNAVQTRTSNLSVVCCLASIRPSPVSSPASYPRSHTHYKQCHTVPTPTTHTKSSMCPNSVHIRTRSQVWACQRKTSHMYMGSALAR